MSDGTSGSILGMTALPVPSVGFSLGTNICHFFSFFFSMCTYLHHLCCLFNWQRWMLGEKKKKIQQPVSGASPQAAALSLPPPASPAFGHMLAD